MASTAASGLTLDQRTELRELIYNALASTSLTPSKRWFSASIGVELIERVQDSGGFLDYLPNKLAEQMLLPNGSVLGTHINHLAKARVFTKPQEYWVIAETGKPVMRRRLMLGEALPVQATTVEVA